MIKTKISKAKYSKVKRYAKYLEKKSDEMKVDNKKKKNNNK